jgi:Na+/melibiose symporter-like transporter
MINPDNDKPKTKYHGHKYYDSQISQRVPEALRWLAFIYLIISVVGFLLLTRPKKIKDDDEEVEILREEECPDMKTGLKTKMFWILFVMALCSITPGIFVASAFKSFGKDKIDDDEFLTTVGALSFIFNGTFRFVWGFTMDYTSFHITYIVLLGVQTVLVTTVYYIAEIEGLYLIWVIVIICCEGGHFVLFPTIIARMFGKE